MKEFTFYTDGAVSKYNSSINENIFYGAFGFILIDSNNDKLFEYCEYSNNTTISLMEATAILYCLDFIEENYKEFENSKITIKSDSQYLVKSFNEYILTWLKNGFKTSNKQDVKHKDLIINIYTKLKKYNVNIIHIKGHNKNSNKFDNFWNSEIDKLVVEKKRNPS